MGIRDHLGLVLAGGAPNADANHRNGVVLSKFAVIVNLLIPVTTNFDC